MRIPESVKPAAWGALGGAVALAILGFTWGGWVTGAAAEKMAKERAQVEVVAAMTPVCVSMAKADPDFEAKLAGIKGMRTYQQRDELMKTGWATPPGAAEASRKVAEACAKALIEDSEA